MENENIINIVDAPCGYGKTSWAIQAMNEASTITHKFIYVTPFLDEVERVKLAVTNREFCDPSSDNGETKLEDLHRLLKEGKDICTTHALFQKANRETKELLQKSNYTLILDEVINVFHQVKLKTDSLNLLLKADAVRIEVDQSGIRFIRWNEELRHYDTEYNDVKVMALSGNLMYCNNNALIWNFPCDVFSSFTEVYILTYLFSGQLQRYYYDLHGIKYRYLSIQNDNGIYNLVPYEHRIIHDKLNLRRLIHIYEGKLNDVGKKNNALSSSWLSKSKDVKQLQKNIYNFFTNIVKAKVDNSLWTTYKSSFEKVKPKSFIGSFLSVTARATNEYSDRYNLAYLVNRYMNPIEKQFFLDYGVTVEQDTWALSEMIQWIWRSQIRNGKSINIYIPSRRMRTLLYRYLSSDEFEEAPIGAITNQYDSDWTW